MREFIPALAFPNVRTSRKLWVTIEFDVLTLQTEPIYLMATVHETDETAILGRALAPENATKRLHAEPRIPTAERRATLVLLHFINRIPIDCVPHGLPSMYDTEFQSRTVGLQR